MRQLRQQCPLLTHSIESSCQSEFFSSLSQHSINNHRFIIYKRTQVNIPANLKTHPFPIQWALVKMEVDPKYLHTYTQTRTNTFPSTPTVNSVHSFVIDPSPMTSFPFVAALLPCVFGSCTEAWQGHIVFLEAWIGCSLPFPLPLRGEEGVLETHARGRGLQNEMWENTNEYVRKCSRWQNNFSL